MQTRIIIGIIWSLLGAIATWRTYHGTLKIWYEKHKETYWTYNKLKNKIMSIRIIALISPILIIGGALSLILVEIIRKNNCWYFTTKNNKTEKICAGVD